MPNKKKIIVNGVNIPLDDIDLSTKYGETQLYSRTLKNVFGTDGVMKETTPSAESVKRVKNINITGAVPAGFDIVIKQQLAIYYEINGFPKE